MTDASGLAAAGDALSAVYHRWLVGAATDDEFAAAGEAYFAAVRERGGAWEKLTSGAFMAPRGAAR